MHDLPNLTLVLGAAASGKSAFAETLVQITPAPHLYIATAQAYDAEMTAKIKLHQQRRGDNWRLFEAPFKLCQAIETADNQPILVDCMTLWLSNHLLAGHDIDGLSDALLKGLKTRKAPTVLVSNEVGMGGIADNALARKFQSAQGRLNQQLAGAADLVILVVAGLPMVLKGALPEGLQ